MTSKQVAKKKETGLTSYNYGDMAGKGFEEVSKDDMVIPFLNILQTNSPQVDDDSIPEAKAGMFFNTATQELYEEIVFQPVYNTKHFVEWVPRNEGGDGAPVAIYDVDSDVVEKAIESNGGNKYGGLTVNGNNLVETHYVYGNLLSADGKDLLDFVVLAFSSTKISPKNKWFMGMMKVHKDVPLIAHRAILGAVKQKNKLGTFYNVVIQPLKGTWKESLINPETQKHLLDEAVANLEMLQAGEKKVDYSQQNSSNGGSDPVAEGNDDIPF